MRAMARYMPTNTFVAAAVTVALADAVCDGAASMAADLAGTYSKSYDDDDLEAQLLDFGRRFGEASKQMEGPMMDPAIALFDLSERIRKLTPDGQRRPFTFFGGTKFKSDPRPLSDRAVEITKEFILYKMKQLTSV